MQVRGRDLQVGDTLAVWFAPKRATITHFEPHTDPHGVFGGEAWVAKFAQRDVGMTVDADGWFEVVGR